MKTPRAIIRYTDAIEQAVENQGQWFVYKEMKGSAAIQTARKYNPAEVVGGIEGLRFGVDENGNLTVAYLPEA